MITLDIPFIQRAQLIAAAEAFATEHCLVNIPVDIEMAVEQNLRIDIAPFCSLKDKYGSDGCHSCDWKTIYVDSFMHRERVNRLRFTIAHEIGHFVLHSNYLKKEHWSSVDEWADLQMQLDQQDVDRMEFQANSFAGLVLVPPKQLNVEFDKILPTFSEQIKQAKYGGLSKDDYADTVISAISQKLSLIFEVSAEVLEKRIKFENLAEKIS